VISSTFFFPSATILRDAVLKKQKKVQDLSSLSSGEQSTQSSPKIIQEYFLDLIMEKLHSIFESPMILNGIGSLLYIGYVLFYNLFSSL